MIVDQRTRAFGKGLSVDIPHWNPIDPASELFWIYHVESLGRHIA